MRAGFMFVCILLLILVVSSCTDTYLGRMIALRGPDVGDYAKLPSRAVASRPGSKPLPTLPHRTWMTDSSLTFNGRDLSTPDAFDAFASQAGTTAFIVLHEGYVLDERYYHGYARDSLFKSFSITKSVLSAAFGIAQADGIIRRTDTLGQHIQGIDHADLRNLPLAVLLDNVSGFKYERGNLPWKQQPRMYYTTDARRYLRHAQLIHPPGTKFEAEDLSPLLVAVALESALRRQRPDDTLSQFVARRLWQPMHAEYPALWNLDHANNGLEKAESGFTARAIDLARFGQLFLSDGVVDGAQIVPREWVDESTTAPPAGAPNHFTDGHYRNLWWGAKRDTRVRQDYYANGHFGQRLYVAPDKQLVLVRMGRDSGGINWTELLGTIADRWPDSHSAKIH